ncbi:hypothetical protein DD794_07645 [Helicobacter pylori]|nr:hypothetical protein DD794_07645 [Helicobacter pylori]
MGKLKSFQSTIKGFYCQVSHYYGNFRGGFCLTFKIAISYNKIIKKVTLKRSTLESGVQFYDKEEK